MAKVLEDEFLMQCWVCVHLEDGPSMTCKAYPKGIPDALLNGVASHSKPYKGDGGIRWKPRPEKADE